MAKRKVKRTLQKTESSPKANRNGNNEPRESQIESQQAQFIDLKVLSDKENKKFELGWNHKDNRMSMSCAEGRDVHASLLQRFSMAFPDFSSAIPPLDDFSSLLARLEEQVFLVLLTCILRIFLEEPSEAQSLAMQEALQTPGVSSQRLSVGMTPKTLRLPKPGEMLLSVHGSLLGVYKENNMEAIRGMKNVASSSFLNIVKALFPYEKENQKKVECLLNLLSRLIVVQKQAK